MSIQDFINEAFTASAENNKENQRVFLYGSKSVRTSLESNETFNLSFETLQLDSEFELAQESQQLDEDLSQKVNQALMERIQHIQSPLNFNSSGLNYFLIDPNGLEDDSKEEIQTLAALARASMYDPQRVIAAFVPVLSPHAPSKAAQSDGYDTVAAIGHHLTQYLSERGVLVLEGLDALKTHIEEKA